MESTKFAYQGKKYTESELLKIAEEKYDNKMAISTLDTRLRQSWPVERALSTPVRKRVKKASDERRYQVLRKTQEKYRKRLEVQEPDRLKIYQTRSYARMYLRKYATLAELDKFQQKIENKIKDLEAAKSAK